MNKKFTMVCASLLLASAFSVNAQTALTPVQGEVAQPALYNAANALEIADGVKFYMVKGSDFVQAETIKTKDGKYVVATSNTTGKAVDAVFEIRNAQKNGDGFIVELYVDGKQFATNTNGGVATKEDKSSDLNYKFYIASKTTDFDGFVTATIPNTNEVAAVKGFSAATTSLDYNAVNLNDFNTSSTTFSFDFSDEELVGNLFKELTPVTFGGATYFVKGAKAAEFAKKVLADDTYTLKAEDIKDKGLQILAIDNKNDYDLNSSKAGEGLKLRMVDAEKFLMYKGGVAAVSNEFAPSDSLSLAGFTDILEADQLNNPEILELTVEPTAAALGLKPSELATNYTIAAVKTSATDTKAYVTTVAAESSWAVVKNAMLGANSYLAASEFLKKDAINTVSILVVNGEPGAEGSNYYKYVTLDNNQDVDYSPASSLDFSLAHNQWVVAGFDGKYTLTLVNRLNGESLTLKLAKKENGYEVVNSALTTMVKDESGNLVSAPAIVKFIGLSTTQTDGYLSLTEEQMKDGIKLSFSGKTDLAGEKEFFGVNPVTSTGSVVLTQMIPSLESVNGVTLFAEKVLTTDKKADKYAQDIEYAYLDANGKVQTKTAENNLVVPTYKFYIKNSEDKLVNALGNYNKGKFVINESVDGKEKATASEYAITKNAAGKYSLVEVNAGSSESKYVETIASLPVVGVTYNPDAASDNDALLFTENATARYDKDVVNTLFANVNILPSVVLNESLPAVPGHYTFDNERGSINVKDLKGINEGFLASEGQVFWLDTADIEKATPSFYISFGKDSVAARNYMFNPIDSAKIFDEYTASYKYNDVYYYGENADKGNGTLKAAFASTVAEEGKDLADAFKFNITLKDAAVADEYVITSVKDPNLYVAQINGVVVLANVAKEDAMAFTVNPAEAPTSNETVSASEVKVVANNGSVVVKNAAGKNVVVSTILGQVVANEVLTSDNATINVPAGIVVVAVDGESFKVNVK